MKRYFITFPLLVGVVAAGLMATAKDGRLSAWTTWFSALTNPKQDERATERFKATLFDQINYSRMAAKMKPLAIDPELQAYLARYEQEVPSDNVDAIAKDVQTAIPRYFRVAACAATRPDIEQLLGEFQPFMQKSEKEMTHFACIVKPGPGGLSRVSLVVVGQRLEDFAPEKISAQTTDSYFNVCSLCGHPHICRVEFQQSSQTLECPACNRTYAVIASDSHGRFRYVNEFLTGYQPPAKYAKDQSEIQKLFAIWGAVHQHCTYTLDPEKKDKVSDCWQTALETQALQKGDCEDSSIFLADWLESQGFQVRVALGRYGDMGGHAWCVVRLGDNDYLLESTEGKPDLTNPPLADLVGSRYVPEVQFDRNAIYVRSKARQSFTGDYWSSKNWTRVEPRNPALSIKEKEDDKKPGRILSANVREASRLFADKNRIAVTQTPKPAAKPFSELIIMPTGPNWEVPVPDPLALADAARQIPVRKATPVQ